MIRGAIIGLAGSAALLASSVNSQENPGWKFADEVDGCSAYYNSANEFHYFALRPDSKFVFRVHSKDWHLVARTGAHIKTTGPSGDFEFEVTTAETSNGWSGVVALLPESAMDMLSASGDFEIVMTDGRSFVHRVPMLDEAVAHLKACATSLHRIPENEYPAQPPRLLSLAVTPNDFRGLPYSAVRFRLDVDRQGKVIGCKITEPSEISEKDMEKICRILSRKAKFEPALNAAGQPVNGTHQRQIKL